MKHHRSGQQAQQCRRQHQRSSRGSARVAATLTLLIAIMVASVVAIVLFSHSATVAGAGMEPTLHAKDRVERAFRGGDRIARFDVVAVKTPAALGFQGGQAVVLRVIGMPGDRVAIQGGKDPVVFLRPAGGTEIVRVESPTWSGRVGTAKASCCDPEGRSADQRAWATVPGGSYWLLGDNWSGAADARRVGFVAASSIDSRLTYRVLPIGSIGSIDNPVRLVPLESGS